MTDKITIERETLLPCPFCGEPAESDSMRAYSQFPSGKRGRAVAVYCTSCSADISVCIEDVPDITMEQVEEMWNRRAALAAQPAEPELTQFEADLLESVGQMKRGEVARVWPAQPVEPAAWRIDACEGTGYPAKWHFFDKKPDGLETFTKQPLYAAPPAPAAVPLTGEQLRDVARECLTPHDLQYLSAMWRIAKQFARAVERAHGIAAAGDKP